jgi:hypothetical protein
MAYILEFTTATASPYRCVGIGVFIAHESEEAAETCSTCTVNSVIRKIRTSSGDAAVKDFLIFG